MGFGWLFLGYFFLFDLPYGGSSVDVIPDLWGFLLLLTAAWRLSPYHPAFFGMRRTLYPLLALELGKYAALWIAYATARPLETVFTLLDLLKLPLLAAMQYFLLTGMGMLCRQVGLTKAEKKCRRNLQIGGVYYFLLFLAVILTNTLPIPQAPEPLFGVWIPLALAFWGIKFFSWIWVVLNLIRIGTCYLQILVPESPRPSRSAQNDTKGGTL